MDDVFSPGNNQRNMYLACQDGEQSIYLIRQAQVHVLPGVIRAYEEEEEEEEEEASKYRAWEVVHVLCFGFVCFVQNSLE